MKRSEGWVNRTGSTEGSLDRKADLSLGMEEDLGKHVLAIGAWSRLPGGVKVLGV